MELLRSWRWQAAGADPVSLVYRGGATRVRCGIARARGRRHEYAETRRAVATQTLLSQPAPPVLAHTRIARVLQSVRLNHDWRIATAPQLHVGGGGTLRRRAGVLARRPAPAARLAARPAMHRRIPVRFTSSWRPCRKAAARRPREGHERGRAAGALPLAAGPTLLLP
jgi:hypothetical protein